MRGRRRARVGAETGTTLIELMVGISLMAIFGGLFTGVVVMMNRSTNKSQSLSQSMSQVSQAFLRLDETVRYATAISSPGQSFNPTVDVTASTNDWYVELRTLTDKGPMCTQLRVHAQQLQMRGPWDAANPDPSLNFRPVASFIINGGDAGGPTTQPFYLVDSTATNVNFQQLTVNLTAESGTGATVTDSSSSVTFMALNSTVTTPDTICAQGMRS